MGFIAQRPAKLSGQDYDVGDPVPDEVVNDGVGASSLIALGVVSWVPDVAGKRARTEATVEAFDPAEHTAPEVSAYLDEHPDQLARVHALEETGRARKTVLNDIDERGVQPVGED